MKRLQRLFKFAVLFTISVIIFFSFYLLWQFQVSKPVIAGQVKVKGLSHEVQIVRDVHGVPHIFGKTSADIYFGLGYAQAQDRFFQMDLTRRLMQGRLSELVGDKTLKYDIQNRIRGFNHVAERIEQELSTEVREALQAFADGVNARLSQGHVAPEYALLMATPENWKIKDTLAVALAMTDNLVVGYEREIARSQLLTKLSPAQVDEFFSAYPDWAPRSINGEDLPLALRAKSNRAAQVQAAESPLNGSNSWVLNSSLTATAHPLLANDPHLALTSPGSFYLAHLALPDGDVAGAVLPGEPFIVIGRNKSLAWTNTTNAIDGEDLVVAPEAGFKDVTESTEVIYVRSKMFWQTSETITVKKTPMGPILDPQWFPLEGFKKSVVLRSVALDPHNGLVSAVYAMSKAQNVADFISAAQAWTAPMTNVLVASTSGDIGLLSTGKLPLRNAQGEWIDFIPWKFQPNIINPKSGYIATANNFITPDSYLYPMPGTYSIYRNARIQQSLREGVQNKISIDMAKLQSLQMDVQSVFVTRVLPQLVNSAQPTSELGKSSLEKLKKWTGEMDANLSEPLIFAAWMKELSKAIYQDELGAELFEKFQGPRTDFLDLVLNGPLKKWCDIQGTEKIESCEDLMGPALDQAVSALQKQFGNDALAWTWGQAHQAYFKHPLFGGAPLLDKIFSIKAKIGGDADTVFAAAYSFAHDYSAVHGPGIRVVYDFSDLQKSQFVLAPGQSGHPWSPHFSDLVGLWAQGKSFELRTDLVPDAAQTDMNTLILQPQL